MYFIGLMLQYFRFLRILCSQLRINLMNKQQGTGRRRKSKCRSQNEHVSIFVDLGSFFSTV